MSEVNHLNEFEKRVGQFIDRTLQSIAEGGKKAISASSGKSEENKKRAAEFSNAQIEVLHVIKAQLPQIKEKIEYMR